MATAWRDESADQWDRLRATFPRTPDGVYVEAGRRLGRLPAVTLAKVVDRLVETCRSQSISVADMVGAYRDLLKDRLIVTEGPLADPAQAAEVKRDREELMAGLAKWRAMPAGPERGAIEARALRWAKAHGLVGQASRFRRAAETGMVGPTSPVEWACATMLSGAPGKFLATFDGDGCDCICHEAIRQGRVPPDGPECPALALADEDCPF